MATYYWVGGSGTWDSATTTNWASSSGGAGGAGVPNNTDTVNFDANSGTAATVTVDATATCLNCTVNKSDINLSLSGSPTFAALLTFTTGTLTLNGYTWTTARVWSNNTNTRAVSFGGGKFVCSGGGSAGYVVWDFRDLTNLTLTGSFAADFTYSGSTGNRLTYHASTAGNVEANGLNATIIGGGDTFSFASNTGYGNLVFSGFTGTYPIGSAGAQTIYGDLTLASGMTLTDGANTATFASTSATPRNITCAGKTIACNVSFNGIGGSWAFADAFVQGSTRALTLTNGTLDLNGNNLTTGTFLSSNTNARTVAFGTGKIILTGNNAAIWSCATLTGMTFTGTPTVDSTYSGSTGTRTFANGSTAGGEQSKAINLNVTAGTDIVTLTTDIKNSFNNLDFTGFAGTLSNSAYSIYGNLIFSTGMTVTGGTAATTFAGTGNSVITSNGKTYDRFITIQKTGASVTLADALNLAARQLSVLNGTFDTAGYNVTCNAILATISTNIPDTLTLKLNNSTVTLSATFNIGTNVATVDAGTSNIVFTGASSGVYNYSPKELVLNDVSFTSTSATAAFEIYALRNKVTFNNLFFVTPSATPFASRIITVGSIQVNGTLTLPVGSTGASVNRVALYSYNITTINAATLGSSLINIDFKGITVTGPTAPWSGTDLGDGGANSGITGFAAPKTVYWSKAAGGSWWDDAWASSSGGATSLANFPLAQDTVIFDNAGLNTSATITTTSNTVGTVDFSARTNAMTINFAAQMHWCGGAVFNSAVTVSGSSSLFCGRDGVSSSITTDGETMPALRICAGTGSVTLTDDMQMNSGGDLFLCSGYIDLNGKTLNLNRLRNATVPTSATVNLNSAVINISGTPFSYTEYSCAGFSFIGTATVNMASASIKSVSNPPNVDMSGFSIVNTGAGALTMSVFTYFAPQINYVKYANLTTTVRPLTVNFGAGQTFEFVDFDISGTSGNLVTLQTTTAGTQAFLTSPNTVNSVSFCSIKDLNATNTVGYGEWQAYTTNGNVDAGNNTGWLFSPAAASTTPRPTIRLRSLAQRGNMQ